MSMCHAILLVGSNPIHVTSLHAWFHVCKLLSLLFHLYLASNVVDRVANVDCS